jgi:hypothetical protein
VKELVWILPILLILLAVGGGALHTDAVDFLKELHNAERRAAEREQQLHPAHVTTSPTEVWWWWRRFYYRAA